jgi:hypothetical protein
MRVRARPEVLVVLCLCLTAAGVIVVAFATGPPPVLVFAPTPGPTVLSDSFSRPDTPASLGIVPNGPSWQAIAGRWGIQNNSAYVSTPVAPASIAVADTGRTSGAIAVTLSVMRNGAGLVFRFRDPQNYWIVVAAGEYGTWVVEKVIGGNVTSVGNIGVPVPVNNGTRIHIDQRGDSFQVWVDQSGNVSIPYSFVDHQLVDARRAGVYALGSASGARFVDFVVSS